jgi:hypothetical protein
MNRCVRKHERVGQTVARLGRLCPERLQMVVLCYCVLDLVLMLQAKTRGYLRPSGSVRTIR